MFAKLKAFRLKKVEIRNARKIAVAKEKYAAQAVGFENGVDPSTGGKIGPIIQTGLGVVKSFFGGNNPEPMPLPYEESGMNSKMVLAGFGALLGVGLLVKILNKK